MSNTPSIWLPRFIDRIMKTTTVRALGVVLIAALFSAIASPQDANAASVLHRILIEKMAFGLPPPGVHVGDRVEWTNKDIFRHSATSTDKSFDLDMEPGETKAVIVRHAGSFQYVCKYHPGMKAELIVEK